MTLVQVTLKRLTLMVGVAGDEAVAGGEQNTAYIYNTLICD